VIADLPSVSRVRADRHHPPERPDAEASMDGPDNGRRLTNGATGQSMVASLGR
jgi:hypothetical protein